MGSFNGPVVSGQRAQVLFLGQRQENDASLLNESVYSILEKSLDLKGYPIYTSCDVSK